MSNNSNDIRELWSGREFLTSDGSATDAVGAYVAINAEEGNEFVQVSVDLRGIVTHLQQSGILTTAIGAKDDIRKALHPLAVIGSMLQNTTLKATEAHEELKVIVSNRKSGRVR